MFFGTMEKKVVLTMCLIVFMFSYFSNVFAESDTSNDYTLIDCID